MKGKKWIIVLALLTLLFIGEVMPALAEVVKPDLKFKMAPRIGYNPIEEWRFGGQVKLENIFGYDGIQWYGDYSVHSKNFHSGLQYLYKYDTYQFYTQMNYDMIAGGVYNEKTLWQDTRSIALGATKANYPIEEQYYYIGDVFVKYEELIPRNTPGEMEFSQGKNIFIEPSIVGFYKGYLGSLDLTYGIPTSISDYHYLKADIFVKKAFDITYQDRIVISSEVGIIRGDYPVQENFFLGSSINNYIPNTLEKIQNDLSSVRNTYQLPQVALDGFKDNAFYGKNMVASRIEYQRAFNGVDWPYGLYPVAKVYTVFGNAWDGDIKTGLLNTNFAVGVGLNFETFMFDRLNTDNWYVGLNLAQGFGEHAALTFGFELGTDLTLLNF